MPIDLLTILRTMPDGSAKMAQSDPHGLTLTLTSLMVVFGVLLMLFVVYSISGAIFSGKAKKWYYKLCRKGPYAKPSTEEESQQDPQIQAAIATALHLYLSQTGHVDEPLKLTIRQSSSPSAWADKSLTMRKSIR